MLHHTFLQCRRLIEMNKENYSVTLLIQSVHDGRNELENLKYYATHKISTGG